MIALGLALAVVSSQVQVAAGLADEVSSARDLTRGRFGIFLAGGGGFAATSFAGGGGLTLEGGLILKDRVSIGARASFITLIALWHLAGVVGVDYQLSEHFGLGAGLGLVLLAGLEAPSSANAVIPVRLTFTPFVRPPDQVGRSTLLLGLEVSPGLAFAASRGYRGAALPPLPAFAIAGQFTIGWSWW